MNRQIKICIMGLLILCMFLLSACCLFHKGMPIRKEEKVYMEVTAYCGCSICTKYYRSCWSCWVVPYYSDGPSRGKKKDIGITADGSEAEKGTIAADIGKYPYGTKMYVPGYGWGEVHDKGTAIKGNHIDIFFESHREALQWGRQKLWVTIIKP